MEQVMDKKLIVSQLDDITTNVAQDLINSFQYNDFVINKTDSGTYTLYKNDKILYEDLYLFTVAFSLAKCLEENDFKGLNKLRLLEENYVKHVNNMFIYKNAKMWELYETSSLYAGDYLILIHNFTKQKIYSK